MKAIIVTEKQNRFSVRFTDDVSKRLDRLKQDDHTILFAEPCEESDKKFMLSHAIKVATSNNQQNIVDLLKAKLVKVTKQEKISDRKRFV